MRLKLKFRNLYKIVFFRKDFSKQNEKQLKKIKICENKNKLYLENKNKNKNEQLYQVKIISIGKIKFQNAQ